MKKSITAVFLSLLVLGILFTGCSGETIDDLKPTKAYDSALIVETFGEEEAAEVEEICDYLSTIKASYKPDADRIAYNTKAIEVKDMGSGRSIYIFTYESGLNMIIQDNESYVTFVMGEQTLQVELGIVIFDNQPDGGEAYYG